MTEAIYNAKVYADRLIPPANNTIVLTNTEYSTEDIMHQVMKMFSDHWWQLKKFSPALVGSNVYETCRNTWQFVKENFKYKADPKNRQYVKSPQAAWATKTVDCKSYSVFIASVLSCLNIPCVFRFVSVNSEPIPTHVYVVVKYQGREIILDCVMPVFDKQEKYTYKVDYMAQRKMYAINGLPKKPRVSGLFDDIIGGVVSGGQQVVGAGPSQAGSQGGIWQDIIGVVQGAGNVINAVTPVWQAGVNLGTQVSNTINPSTSNPGPVYQQVNTGATQNSNEDPKQGTPTPWGKIALGAVIVGGVIYVATKKK